jgi:hypothetical protein
MGAMFLTYERRSHNATRRVRASYHLLTHQEDAGFASHPDLPLLFINDGKLKVGDIVVHNPTFSTDHISWAQKTASGFTRGHLFLTLDRREIHGAIQLGGSEQDAREFHVYGNTAKPFTYKTQITQTPYPKATDPHTLPASAWQDGLDLTISYEQKVGSNSLAPQVSLGGNDVTPYTSWSVDSLGATVITIALDETACDFLPGSYKNASIAFDMYVPVPAGNGVVTGICGGSAPTGVYFWRSVPATAEAAAQPDALATAEAEPLLELSGDLSLSELMTILPDSLVNETANSMLLRNMKYAMGRNGTEKEWLSKFFGQTPPAITDPAQVKLIEKSMDWYQNDFAKSYMTQAFNNYTGPNEPSTRLDSSEVAKLDYHLRQGMAKSPDFTIQQQGIYIQSFITVKTRLQDYIADGGVKWANSLLGALTTDPQFTLMVNRVAGAAGDPAAMGPVNNFATLLTALQPTGEIAKQYYTSILTGIIAKMVPNSVHNDKDTVMEWVPETLTVLLQKIANGEIPDAGGISASEARDMLEIVIKHKLEIAGTLGDLFQSIAATGLVSQTRQVEEKFAEAFQKWPKLAKAGKLMFCVGWIGSLSSVLTALIKGDWKNMSDEEKAEFVTQCVQVGVQAFDAVPLIYNGAKSMTLAVWNKFTSTVNKPVIQSEVQQVGENASGEAGLLRTAAEETAPLMNAGKLGQGTLYARLFGEGILAGVLKIMGAICAVAMAAWSLWQLIDDITHHGSVTTIVFDSLIFAANFLSAVCLVADLLVATTFLPIAGAVLALVGVIVAFIATFLEKPKNPIEDFMKDVAVPFAKGLPAPPPALARAMPRISMSFAAATV